MIKVEEFLNEQVVGDSTKKSYVTLFRRIEEFEKQFNKKVEDWNKEDCIHFLSNLGSRKYNTVAVKWSLLKKYLFYIGNKTYSEMIKLDLEKIEDGAIQYIPMDRVIKVSKIFENKLDQALLLLLRQGIKGEEFAELSELKTVDINNGVVKLNNREVVLDNYVATIMELAKKERGYHMDVTEAKEQGKRIAYSYYGYNNESEYFWKNRPNKFNDYGLLPMKTNAAKVKINSIIRKVNKYEGNNDISVTSLVVSYVIDEILKVEKSLDIVFSERQTRIFIDKLGIKCNLFTVFTLKNEVGGN